MSPPRQSLTKSAQLTLDIPSGPSTDRRRHYRGAAWRSAAGGARDRRVEVPANLRSSGTLKAELLAFIKSLGLTSAASPRGTPPTQPISRLAGGRRAGKYRLAATPIDGAAATCFAGVRSLIVLAEFERAASQNTVKRESWPAPHGGLSFAWATTITRYRAQAWPHRSMAAARAEPEMLCR